MPEVTFDGSTYQNRDGESVLATLLRHGVEVSHSCQAGACQTCLLKAAKGAPPQEATRGLKETLASQGWFLACRWQPSEDIEILEAAASLDHDAEVQDCDLLADNVYRVRLKVEGAFDFVPGQYLHVVHPEGAARAYSIASLPTDGHVELHVRRHERGRVSPWITDRLSPRETVTVRGPHGACFYIESKRDRTLLLAGTGTGLSPLWGIARDALEKGHRRPIHLFHGGRMEKRLYYVDEIRALEADHDNVHYHPWIGEQSTTGFADTVARALSEPKTSTAYLCGSPELVRELRKKLFMAGMTMQEIHVDAFERTKVVDT